MRRPLAGRRAAPGPADRSVGRHAGRNIRGRGALDARILYRICPAEQYRSAAARPAGRKQQHRALDGPLQPAARPECLRGRRRLVRPRPDERQHLPKQQPDLGVAQRIGLDAPVSGHAHQPPDRRGQAEPRRRRAGSRTHPRGCGDQRHDALPAGALRQGDGGHLRAGRWPPRASSPNRSSTRAKRSWPTTA